MTNAEMVRYFMAVNEQHIESKPGFPPQKIIDLGRSLINEEFYEFTRAVTKKDLVEASDGIIDLLYVVYWTANSMGLPVDELFAEVQKSNLSKLDESGKPIKREDGKILKGPNFVEPDLKTILLQYGAEI